MRNRRSVILSWLIGATIIASSAIVPAATQERLRVIAALAMIEAAAPKDEIEGALGAAGL
jgi:hypothetical protein